ncbi:hypothetical protein DFJ63DRAFT_314946 [Scheffersomyces coipomensis]|uniref:uncharacterized protein n=1 Tax=Scheffersomyces coipomensis TaxID=1788519 RepID=UPI00315C80DC
MSIPNPDIMTTPNSYNYSSRRNSLTSISTVNTTLTSTGNTSSNSVRDLSTDNLLGLDNKFRKKQIKRVPNGIKSPASASSQQQQQKLPKQLIIPQQSPQGPNSAQSPDSNTTYYFPNGEIFRPRTAPLKRNRPQKINHHHNQPPPPPHHQSHSHQYQQYPSHHHPAAHNQQQHHYQVPPVQQQQQYYHPPPQHYNPHYNHYPPQSHYTYNQQQQLQPALSVPSSRSNSITSSAPPVFHHLPPHLQNQVLHLQQQQPPAISSTDSPSSIPSSSNSSLSTESIQKINSLTSLNNSSSTTITSTSTNNGSPSTIPYNYPKKLPNPMVKNNNLRSPQSGSNGAPPPGSVTPVNDMANFNKYNRSSSITSISSVQRQQLLQSQPAVTIHSPQHTSQSYPNLSQFQPYHSYTNLASNQQGNSSSSSSSSSPSQRLVLQSNNLLRTASPQFSTNSLSNPSSTSNSIKNNSSVENIEQQQHKSLTITPINETGSKERLLKTASNYSTSSHSYNSSTSSSNSMNNTNVGGSDNEIQNNGNETINNNNQLHRRSSTSTPTTSISNDEKEIFEQDDDKDVIEEKKPEVEKVNDVVSPIQEAVVIPEEVEEIPEATEVLSSPAVINESPEELDEKEAKVEEAKQPVQEIQEVEQVETEPEVIKEAIKPPLLKSVSSSEDEDNDDIFKTPRNSILFSNDNNKLVNNESKTSIENYENMKWEDPQGSSNLTNETLKDEENDKIQTESEEHQPSTIEIAPPNTVESSLPDPDIENSPPFDIIDDYTVLDVDEEPEQIELESAEENDKSIVLEDHLNLASPVRINSVDNTLDLIEDEPPLERSSLTSEEDSTSSDAYSFEGPENLVLRTVDNHENNISAPKEAIEEMPSPSESIMVSEERQPADEPVVIRERKESLPQAPIVKKKSMLDVLDEEVKTTTPIVKTKTTTATTTATASPQKSLKSRTKSLPELHPEASSSSSYKSQSNGNLKSLWKKMLVPPKLPNKSEMLKNSFNKNSSEVSLSSNSTAAASFSTVTSNATSKFKKSFSVANLKKANPMKGMNIQKAYSQPVVKPVAKPLPFPPPVPEKPLPVYDLTLPSIEHDTDDLFDDVMLTFDERLDGVQDSILTENGLESLVKPVFPAGGLRPSKSSSDSVINEPFLKDDELTSAQIKDAQIKDNSGNTKGGSNANGNRNSSIDDLYIDDNIRFLQSEFNWSNLDDSVNKENNSSGNEVEEDDNVSEEFKNTMTTSDDEANSSPPPSDRNERETIVINNEQLYTIFHNLTDFQKRNLPPHLKYIKQFKDFQFVEINLSKFEEIPSIHTEDSEKRKSLPILKRRNNLPQFNVDDNNSNKKKVLFSHKIEINETYAPDCYKRYNKAVTQYTLTEHSEISKIKNELNYYKCNEMLVHEKSQTNTHFFYL